MENLERYLDRVCRGIGGPRSLRSHVRRELREHLLDAATEHRSAGLSEEDALARALEDFGGAEQVGSELEATHGHRLTTVLIDKALEWKERTMKAKWIWTTWVHVALSVVIILEVVFVALATIFVMPRVELIAMRAGTDLNTLMPGTVGFLGFLDFVGSAAVFLLIALAALWGLFEWRFRGENKSLVRLSLMGTASVALTGVVVMSGATMAIPMAVAAPMLESRFPERVVNDEMAGVEKSIAALDEAMLGNNWTTILDHANTAANQMGHLAHLGGAAPAIVAATEQPKIDVLRTELESASQSLRDARTAAWEKDTARLNAAMKKFHETYVQLRGAMTTAK